MSEETLQAILQRIALQTERANQLADWLKNKQDIETIADVKKLTEGSLNVLVQRLDATEEFPVFIPETLRREFLPYVLQGPIPFEDLVKILKTVQEQVRNSTENVGPNVCSHCRLPIIDETNTLVPGTLQYHALCQPKNGPLFDRNEAHNIMEIHLTNNINNIATRDKAQLTILTAFGFGGIGKTALGLSGAELVHAGKPVAFALVDFSTGDSLDDREDFPVALGLRVFARLFCQISFKQLSPYAKALLSNEHAKELCNIRTILRAYKHLHTDEVACVLHFDEVNMLPGTRFTQLVEEIGIYMCDPMLGGTASKINFALLPIITGTASILEGPIKSSRFGCVSLPVPLLSNASCVAVVEQPVPLVARPSLFAYGKFKKLMASALGLPRLVQAIKTAVEDILPQYNFFVSEESIGAVQRQFVALVTSRYKIDLWISMFTPETFLIILYWCLRGSNILRDGSTLYGTLPDNSKITHPFGNASTSFALLEQNGFLFLLDSKVCLPYIIIYVLSCTSLMPSTLYPIIKLPTEEVYWQEYEQLEPAFLSLLISSMRAAGLRTAPLGLIWRGLYGSETVRGLTVQLPPSLAIRDEKECWIENKSCDNVDGAPIYPVRHLNDMHVRCTDNSMPAIAGSNTIFRCEANNPLIDIRSAWTMNDGRTLVVFEQLKKTATNSLITATEIKTWYNQAVATVKPWVTKFNFVTAFVFLSTYAIRWDISKDDLITNCENLLLLDKDCKEEYFSHTFAPMVTNKD